MAGRPQLLTRRTEDILRAIYFYRYMTAIDVATLLFSPKSLAYVRSILTSLAGGADFQANNYLYRFHLPAIGNAERIYTLGSKGRDFLASELGLPVEWYFRPNKVKHLSYRHTTHNLILTRFLVAAHRWSAQHSAMRLVKTRISYELSKIPGHVETVKGGEAEVVMVVPDAWLCFERSDGRRAPILVEIDRGREYQEAFKAHVHSRVEFIASGEYTRVFGTKGVTVAYATTGERPEYRETRRRAMCAWTREVLAEVRRESWASVFRFGSVSLDAMYGTPLFDAPVWFRPDSEAPVLLLTP